MGISGVGSFPVWSGGSLIFFQLFRCRNLALNRVFSYILVADMFLYLGDLDTPIFICPLNSYTPRVYTSPYAPHILLCLCVFGGFACCGGCIGLPFVLGHLLTSSLFGDASPYLHPLSHWFPVHQYVSGISVCYVGISLLLKGMGVFPHQLGGLGCIST